jgi:nucleotide-binding universal stress UspA family protein
MKKILLPCDFSKPSREAFRFALQLAERSKGEIYVLKVTELPVLHEPGFGLPEYGFESGLLGEIEEETSGRLKKLLAECGVTGDNVTLLNETGPVISTIRKVAEKGKIDVIVMGTHGEGNWLDTLLGTNTEKIIRTSTVPVFAMRKSVPITGIKNIVFPTTLPLDREKTMQKVIKLQNYFSAKLHILYVNSPADFHSDKDIRRRMNEFVQTYPLKNYTLNIYNDLSDEKGIINFTRDVEGDMIAMITHGRKGLAQLFNYSLTEDVLEDIEWPLWSCVLEK